MLLDIMDDHGLERTIPFPTRDHLTLDSYLFTGTILEYFLSRQT